MKKIFTLSICLLFAWAAFGQQEDQFTQFMYQKQLFNPGYAGSENQAMATALVRNQWLGFEGAPQTQLATFNTPLFNNKVGVGANIYRQTIGLTDRYAADAIYAYRFNLGRGVMSAGLQASVRLIQTNFNSARPVEPITEDGAIPMGVQSKFNPNFGAGLYYRHQDGQFYVGFSVPYMLQNDINLAGNTGGVISKEIRHIYAMGGGRFEVSDQIEIQPNVLLKYVAGAPFDADVNVTGVFMDRFSAGISYRIGGPKASGIGESVAMLLGVDATDKITIGLSYDYSISQFNDFNNGTIEGVIRFRFKGKENKDKTYDDGDGQEDEGEEFYN